MENNSFKNTNIDFVMEFYHEKTISNVLIDGSIILNPRLGNKLYNFILKNESDFNFFVGKTIYDAILSKDIKFLKKIYSFYRIALRRTLREEIEIRKISDLIMDQFLSIKNLVKPFSIDKISSEIDLRKKYEIIYLNLKQSFPSLEEFLFEEWVFLQEYSWIVAKFKRIFIVFQNTGAYIIEYSKWGYEILKRKLELMVKRELRYDEDNIINKFDKLRVLGKWIGKSIPDFMFLNQDIFFLALGLKVLFAIILVDP